MNIYMYCDRQVVIQLLVNLSLNCLGGCWRNSGQLVGLVHNMFHVPLILISWTFHTIKTAFRLTRNLPFRHSYINEYSRFIASRGGWKVAKLNLEFSCGDN